MGFPVKYRLNELRQKRDIFLRLRNREKARNRHIKDLKCEDFFLLLEELEIASGLREKEGE